MPDDRLGHLELTFLLGLAFQVMLSEFVDRLNQAGYPDLRPMHGLVFQALGQAGATSTELADRLGVTKQAAGQIVDDLEGRGYVRRQPHPLGGRRRLIVLTERAQTHLRVAGGVLSGLEAEVSAKTGAEDLTQARLTLIRLIRGFVNDEIPPLRPVW